MTASYSFQYNEQEKMYLMDLENESCEWKTLNICKKKVLYTQE